MQPGVSLGRGVEGSNRWTESTCQIPVDVFGGGGGDTPNRRRQQQRTVSLEKDDNTDTYNAVCLPMESEYIRTILVRTSGEYNGFSAGQPKADLFNSARAWLVGWHLLKCAFLELARMVA